MNGAQNRRDLAANAEDLFPVARPAKGDSAPSPWDATPGRDLLVTPGHLSSSHRAGGAVESDGRELQAAAHDLLGRTISGALVLAEAAVANLVLKARVRLILLAVVLRHLIGAGFAFGPALERPILEPTFRRACARIIEAEHGEAALLRERI